MLRGLALLTILFSSASWGAQDAETVSTIYPRIRARTLQKSYDLRIAEANESQSSSAHYTAVTRWVPHVDFSLSHLRERNFAIITSGAIGQIGFQITPQAVTLARWDLDVTMPLYKRAVHVGVEQASAEKELSRDRLRAKQTEIDWRLRQLLGDYFLQSYKEETLKGSIELARTNLREAELRFELGQRTKVDVLKSRANVVTLDSRREQYRQLRVSALNELQQYTGLTDPELKETGVDGLLRSEKALFETIDEFSETKPVFETLKPYLEGEKASVEAVSRAAASSPVYSGYVSEETLAMRRASSLNAENFPELALRGNLNKQAPDWSDAFSSGNVSYSFAAVLKIPIFSGLSLASTWNEKNRAQDAAALKAERDLIKFRSELEDDRNRILSLKTQLQALELSRQQNEEIVRLSVKSYQLGKANLLELLTSQNELIDAKINLAQAKIDLSVLARKYAWNIGVPVE